MNRGAGRVRAILPDRFYYLSNFLAVIAAIERRYDDLLFDQERQFIAGFRGLPRASQALFVRMVVRKGVLFRQSRLNYGEIGATADAMAPLIELGWVDDDPILDLAQLQHVLTKAELVRHVAKIPRYRSWRKPDLVVALQAAQPLPRTFAEWCEGSADRVVEFGLADLCERFRLMFFGNFHQDWTDFVLADLGLFRFEKVPAGSQSLAFRTRAHVDAFERIGQCRRNLDDGVELPRIAADIPGQIEDNDWLEDHRQRLLYYIGLAHARAGDAAAALRILSSNTHRDARVRTIRLLEAAQQWNDAKDLCESALRAADGGIEQQQIVRILRRLNRRLGVRDVDAPTPAEIPSFQLTPTTIAANGSVERLVRDSLMRGARERCSVHYVENRLVNTLFGLLCWNAVFAPVPGAFFHDYQAAPVDIASGQFVRRRRREFDECLAQLNSDAYKDTILHCAALKAGIQTPFVDWGLLSGDVLHEALSCFPAAHLRLWFEWILRDVVNNRAGFPDLVQFWPGRRCYRLIEVKGPGDRLQDNQRRLLAFCVAHQMPVSVCWVTTPPRHDRPLRFKPDLYNQ